MYKYITFGFNSFLKELWMEPKNENFVKPSGGLWASKYTPDEPYLSSWQQWCKSSNFTTGRMDIAVIFNLKEDARICTINSLNDLKLLMSKYKEKTSLPFFNTLDFEKIAKDYDVIELTEKGQIETRYSRPDTLYGWDVESILILNFDVIREQKGIII